MAEYASNSEKSKKAAEESEKRLTKVTKGATKQKKKGEMQKLKESCFSADMAKIKEYIFLDVLVPSFKKAISDIVTNGIEMILYGEVKHTSKGTPAGKVSYSSYYAGGANKKEHAPVRAGSGFNYDDIVFENRGDAESVLSAMEETIERYGFVSVLDMYDLADVSTNNHTLGKYGWTDLHEAKTVFSQGNYMIKLPKVEPLK